MKLLFPRHATIAVPERLVLRGGGRARVPLAVRYGVLLRDGRGPVLLDAGWPEPRPGDGRALRLYRAALRARVHPRAGPLATLASLGFRGGEVETVILSHLHADHLGALRDLSRAHAIGPAAALHRAHRRGALANLRHAVVPELLPRAVEDAAAAREVAAPHGLGRGRDLLGDGSCLSVALPGHADGHAGVLLPAFDPPVLWAADAQWVLRAVAEDRPPRGPARLATAEPAAVAATIARLRRFTEAGGQVVLAHDPADLPVLAA